MSGNSQCDVAAQPQSFIYSLLVYRRCDDAADVTTAGPFKLYLDGIALEESKPEESRGMSSLRGGSYEVKNNSLRAQPVCLRW